MRIQVVIFLLVQGPIQDDSNLTTNLRSIVSVHQPVCGVSPFASSNLCSLPASQSHSAQGPGQEGGKVTTNLRSIVSVPGTEAVAALYTSSAINALTASPDGASIAAACADGTLRIYDVSSQRLIGGFKVRSRPRLH